MKRSRWTFCKNTSNVSPILAIMQLPPNQAKNARVQKKTHRRHTWKEETQTFSPFSLCHSFRMRWRRRVLLWGHNTTRGRFTRPFRFIFAKKKFGGPRQKKNSEMPIVIPSAKQKRKKYPEIERLVSLWEVWYSRVSNNRTASSKRT